LTGYSIEEEVFEGHYRVIRIDTGDTRIYSIDVYKLLQEPVDCEEQVRLGEAELCYKTITKGCEAVILRTPGRTELVNLRLHTRPRDDPAMGSPARARNLCLEALREWLRA